MNLLKKGVLFNLSIAFVIKYFLADFIITFIEISKVVSDGYFIKTSIYNQFS